eukprot:Polyplicarium_translucidae@DN2976_c0_g1_i5.p2
MGVVNALLGRELERLHEETKSAILVPTGDIITEGIVGFYFSAQYCGPCRQFTPILCTFYRKAKIARKKFEVVFCSVDRSEEEFNRYRTEMPWASVPFKNADVVRRLRSIWSVRYVPTLVLMDCSGAVLDRDGVQRIVSSGDEFLVSLPCPPSAPPVAETPRSPGGPRGAVKVLREMTVEKKLEAFDTLILALGNVLQYPNEQKFRKINKSNARLQRTLADEELQGLLVFAGFRDEEDAFFCPDDVDVHRMREVHATLLCLIETYRVSLTQAQP